MSGLYIEDWGYDEEKDVIILHLTNGARIEVQPTEQWFGILENHFK